MKILIVSDTHRHDENLEIVLEKEKNIDELIHLGDVEGSEDYIRAIAGCPCYMVAGNNDYFSMLDREIIMEIGNYKVLLTIIGEDDIVYIVAGDTNETKQHRSKDSLQKTLLAECCRTTSHCTIHFVKASFPK